jgi:A/G-specific adenine glycosylase
VARNTDSQADALLAWFAAHHRRLPWREQPTPYAVLVSELMLQQTRVDTVIDYFTRWMTRFPTLADLAAASQGDVLAMWTGLGYYNRARNLHATAQRVLAEHGGQMPQDDAALRALPGLGPYTVGAVLSIAFAQPAALVDGNVARVLSRWTAFEGDPSQPKGRAHIWQIAEQWLQEPSPRAQPGAWNQALMELGAMVCTPRSPDCGHCPVQAFCQARALGLQQAIPPVKQKAPPQLVRAAYAVMVSDNSGVAGVADAEPFVLLGRRPDDVRWAGLWEPPGVEGLDCLEVLNARLRAEGLTPEAPLGPIVHILTHRRYEVLAVPVRVRGDRLPQLAAFAYPELRWQAVSQALGKTSGLSRLAQKLLTTVM